MNDLERDLRELLAEDAQHVPTRDRAPDDLGRHARRRQGRFAAVVGLGALTVIAAVVAGSALLVPLGDRDPGGRPGGTGDDDRTSTVRGVTITYPADWTLLELTEEVAVGEGPVGPEGTIVGEAILELTSHERPPSTSVCHLGAAQPEASEAVLYVQVLDHPRVPGTTPAPWPVTPGGPLAVPQPITCEAAFEHYATWSAEGRIYEAFLTGSGPAYDRLLAAFASLGFDRDVPATDPIQVAPGQIAIGPYEVLRSGVADGQRWNLLVYPSSTPYVTARLCIGLEVEGIHVGGLCDLDMAATEASGGAELGFEGASVRVRSGGSTVTYAFGALHDDIDQIGFQGERPEEIESFRSDIPAGFEVGFDALVVIADADAAGAITTFVGSDMVGALPFGLSGTETIDV